MKTATATEPEKSIGHICFHSDKEYVRYPTGDVYESPVKSIMMAHGFRGSHRFLCTAAAWPLYCKIHGISA